MLVLRQGGEAIPRKKDAGERLRQQGTEAAALAAERLVELLQNPDTSPADVLKAATLIFDRVYPAVAGSQEAGGDYEICVKEE